MSGDMKVKTPPAAPPPAAPPPAAGGSQGAPAVAAPKVPSSKALKIESDGEGAAKTPSAGEIYSWFNLPKLEKPKVSMTEVVQELRNLQQIIGSKQLSADRTAITIGDKRMQSIHKANLKKEKEIAKKINEVQHESLWQKIVGWLSTAITLIAATIATIATGGAAAPLLAAAILGTVVMIMQETGTMKKVAAGFTDMFEAFGMSKKDAKKAGAITAAVTIAVVMIVTSVVATALSGGADAAGLAATVYQVTKIVSQLVGAGLTISQGSLDIAQGVDNYQVANLKADEQKNRANLGSMDFFRQVSNDDLKKVSQEFQNIETYITDALRTQAQSQELNIRNMA